MNRFKRELRKRGFTLECDYEELPYKGLETVVVHADRATYSTYHVSAGWETWQFDRSMNFTWSWPEDDVNPSISFD